MTDRSARIAGTATMPTAHDPTLAAELDRVGFRHLLPLLATQRLHEKMFELIEDGRFLAAQTDHSTGFGLTAEQIGAHALPAAIAARDWPRVTHYTLLWLNLGGAADRLGREDVIGAMARSNRSRPLALAIARQRHGRRRVRSLVAVLENLPVESGDWESLVRELRDLLPELPEPRSADEAAADARLLERLIALLGPERGLPWQALALRLRAFPAAHRSLLLALAEAWLSRQGSRSPTAWRLLAKLDAADELASRLPSALAGAVEPRRVPDLLDELMSRLLELHDPDRRVLWNIVTELLSHAARADRRRVRTVWEAAAEAHGPVPWTPELLERAGPLLAALDEPGRERIAASLPNPRLRAAFWTSYLRAADDRAPGAASAARSAVEASEAIGDGAERLSWRLRAATAAASVLAPEELDRQVARAAGEVAKHRGEVGGEVLALYLDLVDRVAPDEVGAATWRYVSAAGGRSEVVIEAARCVRSPRVLEQLLERAEAIAAAAAGDDRSGFERRARLLHVLLCRLCRHEGSIERLIAAHERLLPEEEDEVRAELCRRLAEDGRAGLAASVAAGIGQPGPRLTARLSLTADDDAGSPAELYRTVASLDAARDELTGLGLLCRPPVPIERSFHELEDALVDPWRRLDFALWLVDHALAHEAAAYPPAHRDPVPALRSLAAVAAATPAEPALVDRLPELVERTVAEGPEAVADEIAATCEHLLTLDSVPWPVRRTAIEILLGRAPELLARSGTGALVVRRAERRLVELLLRLPERAADRLRRDEWHQVLPPLLAVGRRLPGVSSRRFLRRAAERLHRPTSLAAVTVVDVPAVAFEAVSDEPERLPELLERLPAEVADRLAFSLTVGGWLADGPPARALAAGIGDPGLRRRARLARWPDELPAAELVDLLIAERHPLPTAAIPRLWSETSAEIVDRLAAALGDAVAAADPGAAEHRLRLLWHAVVAPRLGRGDPAAIGRATELAAAVERAGRLAAPAAEPSAPDSSGRPPPDDRHRLTSLFRRWAEVRKRWQLLHRVDAAGWALLIALLAIPPLMCLDYPLYGATGRRGLDSGVVLLLMTALGALQGILVDRLIAGASPDDSRLRPSIRLARRLAAMVPLFGFLIIPLWSRLTRRFGERWRLPGSRSRPCARRGSHGRLGRLADRLLSLGWLIGLALAETAVVTAFIVAQASWLTRHPLPLLAVSLPLHLMAAAAAWHGLRTRLPLTQNPGVVALAALCWLPPVPLLPLLGFLPLLFLQDTSAPGVGTGGTKEPGWPEVQQRLRSTWRHARGPVELRGRPPELETAPTWGRGASRRLLLLRLRTGILAPELALLVWALLATPPPIRPYVELVLLGLLGLSLLLCVAGRVVALRRWLGPRPEPAGEDPSAPDEHLSLVSIVAALGLLLGIALARDDREMMRGLLLVAGLVGAAFHALARSLLGAWLSLRPKVPEPDRGSLVLVFLFAGLGLSGLLDIFPPSDGLLLATTGWTVVVGAVNACLLPWLLRPASVAGFLSGTYPRPVRLRLLLLAASALLPLGGLAIPAWRRWRRGVAAVSLAAAGGARAGTR